VVPTASDSLLLLLREAGGGVLFGAVLGYVAFRLLKGIDSYQVELLVTLAVVTGGYALASRLHVSGPLAMVVCGVIIGNGGRALAMSDLTRRYIDLFWELIDEILNAVLFVLIGMEVVLVSFSGGRSSPRRPPMAARPDRRRSGRVDEALVQAAARCRLGADLGGLRGGISVALALSLPAGPQRDIVLALTYCVVVFSILGQGLTLGRVIRASLARAPDPPSR